MYLYKTVLVAVDFSGRCGEVLAKSLQLARLSGASLKVVHVMELPAGPVLEDVAILGLPTVSDSDLSVGMMEESNLSKKTRERMNALLLEAGLEVGQGTLLMGAASTELLNYAAQINADLIVMGRHKVHGLQYLLGSTIDRVLNQATCDVLAVNLKDKIG